MTELTQLDPKNHGDFKIAPNCAVNLAKDQHVITLRVTELAHAATSFPLFATRVEGTDGWALSAIASYEVGKNLFVDGDQWQASYHPVGMLTYPLFLMKVPNAEKDYTVGILEDSDAFSKEEGEALFDGDGKASAYLSRSTALLEDSLKSEIHTHQFTRKLSEMGLFKSVDVLVQYEGGAINTLKGLHSIDEVKLQSLTAEEFEDLRQKNYLAPIYAMLISIYQLNALLKRNNNVTGMKRIQGVALESAKDDGKEEAKEGTS